MKRLLASLTICFPLYLFAQGFGSFSHDQPFFSGGSSASGADNPPDYPNAFFDYDVGDTNTDGDLISTLYDLTPNKFHLMASGAQRPYWTNNPSRFNGHGFLHFDGVDNYMRTNFGVFAAPLTIYAVMTLNTEGFGNREYWGAEVGSASWEFIRNPGHQLFLGGALGLPASGPYVAGMSCVVTIIENTSGNDEAKINNVSWSAGSAGDNPLEGLILGNNAANNAKCQYQIARLIGYNGSHSDATQTLVYSWLTNRYNP